VEPLASMRGVTKFIYGSDGRPLRNTEVKILDGVDFDVFPGEVHVLVGENGAGKSTLMRILGGVIPPDRGELRIAGETVSSDFRCPLCQGLYEVVYPWSQDVGTHAVGAPDLPSDVRLPNPSALRWLWQERRTSTMAVDQSGVWRFRDLLPIVDNMDKVVTLREGNTPLYELPKCAADLTYDGVMALPAKPAAARRCASPASEQTPDRLTVPGIGFPAAAASAQSRAGLRHTGNKIFWLVIKWKIEIDRSQPGGLRAYSA